MALNQVSAVPAGVLRVISDEFLAPIRVFSKEAPTTFRKHIPSGMGTESLGMIGCIFAENGTLECGIESSFWGTGWGAKGDFIRYSYLQYFSKPGDTFLVLPGRRNATACLAWRRLGLPCAALPGQAR